MSQEKFWNDNASRWAEVIETGGIASRAVTNQAILDEIRNLAPRTVLDVGCGEGWLSDPLLDSGIQYLGVDGAKELVSIARSKRRGPFEYVSYSQIAAGGWVPAQKVDLAVFNFSLLEEDLAPILRQISGWLSAGGHLLIQTLHPRNLPEYRDGWNTEDFKSMSVPFKGTMPWYARTLESWTALFQECGLLTEKLVEPALDGKAVSVIFVLRV